jgi:hypothetical protein
MKISQTSPSQETTPTKSSWNLNARAQDTTDANITWEYDHTVSSPLSHLGLNRDEICFSPRRRSPINRRRMKLDVRNEARSSESWSSRSFRAWSAIFILGIACWLVGSNSLLLAPSSMNKFHEAVTARENLDFESTLSFVQRCERLQLHLKDQMLTPTAETNIHDPQVDSEVEKKNSHLTALWTSLNCSSLLTIVYPQKENAFQRVREDRFSDDERGGPDPSSSSIVEPRTIVALQSNLLSRIQIHSWQTYATDSIPKITPISSSQQSEAPGGAVLDINRSYLTPLPHTGAEPFRSRLLQARPSIRWHYTLPDGTHLELEQVPPDIAAAVGAEYTAWDRARSAPPPPKLSPAAASGPLGGLGQNSSAGAGEAGRSVINRIWVWGKRRRRSGATRMDGLTLAARGARVAQVSGAAARRRSRTCSSTTSTCRAATATPRAKAAAWWAVFRGSTVRLTGNTAG